MSAQPHLTDNRALLATIGHRLVRAVASETTPYSAALFGVVLQRQREWSSSEWQAALVELDESALTVSQFLTAEHQRGKRTSDQPAAPQRYTPIATDNAEPYDAVLAPEVRHDEPGDDA